MHSARDAINRADQEKAAADKALADARAALQTATTALPPSKKSTHRPPPPRPGPTRPSPKEGRLDAALAKVQALKAEVDALAVEKKRFGRRPRGAWPPPHDVGRERNRARPPLAADVSDDLANSCAREERLAIMANGLTNHVACLRTQHLTVNLKHGAARWMMPRSFGTLTTIPEEAVSHRKRVTLKIEQTPEELAELKAERSRFSL